MVLPLIGAAIGGVAGLAGAAISSSATKKAAKIAAQTAADNNALARETRDLISGYVSPYMPGAYGATNELSRLLGSGGNALGAPTAAGGYDVNAYIAANPDVLAARPSIEAQGVIGPGKQWSSFEDWVAREHLPNALRNNEQRLYPKLADTQAAQQTDPMEAGYYGPAFDPRQTYTRPTYTRPTYGDAPAAPNIDPSAYEKSPYFDWLLNQGNRNLKAGAAAGGLGQSGSALKEAISYGQGLAGQDYQKWVNNQLALDSIARQQWNADRAFNNQNFDVDTMRDIAIYDADRAYDTAIYDADRAYDTSRFDTRVGNLFALSNQGLGAAGTLAGNAGNYYANVASNNNAAASAAGNAAISNANSVNNLLGAGLQGLGYFYGANGGGAPKTSSSGSGWSILF